MSLRCAWNHQRHSLTLFAFVQAYVAEVICYMCTSDVHSTVTLLFLRVYKSVCWQPVASDLTSFIVLVTFSFRPTICRHIGLPSFLSPPSSQRASVLLQSHLVASHPVRYSSSVAIRSLMYDTHLRATHMTTSSIGGVQIPIYLVSNTTDSL